MTAQRLTRLYDSLTAEERVALAFAASARGDDAEFERLNSSAPLERWLIADHCRVSRAITICALAYQTEQLETVGGYWFAAGRICAADDESIDARLWANAAEVLAYRFCVNTEAWRLFCESRGFCPTDVLRGMPGSWLVDLAEISMPEVALERDDVAQLLREEFPGVTDEETNAEIATAETVLANWHSTYEALLGG